MSNLIILYVSYSGSKVQVRLLDRHNYEMVSPHLVKPNMLVPYASDLLSKFHADRPLILYGSGLNPCKLAKALEHFSPSIQSISMGIDLPGSVDFRLTILQKFTRYFNNILKLVGALKLRLLWEQFDSNDQKLVKREILDKFYPEQITQVGIEDIQMLKFTLQSKFHLADELEFKQEYLNEIVDVIEIIHSMEKVSNSLFTTYLPPALQTIDIPGILKIGLACELGDIRRFGNYQTIVRSSGFDLPTSEAKEGWQFLRSYLGMSSHYLLKNNIKYRDYYQRKYETFYLSKKKFPEKQAFLDTTGNLTRQLFRAMASNEEFRNS